MKRVIKIATEFSDTPLGRYRSDGDFSGERFRDELLVPALRNPTDELAVDLNGTEGFGSSFLEEAFGGLVRESGFTKTYLTSHLTIIADGEYELYARQIWKAIEKAKPRST